MRITQFTDYSLRVLIYLGLKDDMATVTEITQAFKISNNHLVKVVHHLAQKGYIQSFKGRHGGIQLAKPAAEIKIGSFIRELEPMDLLECFNAQTNTCPIRGVCQLERSLYEAQKAFTDTLDRYTLADYLKPSPQKDARMKRLGL